MIPQPSWYKPLERKLEEVQGLTDALLVAVVVISIVLIWKGDNVVKTAWAVYLLMP